VPDIVISTLNAKFIHASFGLRYLMANLGPLRSRARLLEFDINQRPLEIVEKLLAENPRILGLGIYIWNVTETTEVVAILKRLRPDIVVILGGPEVSHETEQQEIVRLADHVITGEADLKFAEVCGQLLLGDGVALIRSGDHPPQKPPLPPTGLGVRQSSGAFDRSRPPERQRAGALQDADAPPITPGEGSWVAKPDEGLPKIIPATLPDFSQFALPYDLYDERDIAHRIIYVEASRGCPFSCEFCLSSLDVRVRAANLPVFFGEMQKLLDRGVKQFKFVDRTFNLSIPTSLAILEFFLARHQPGNFYHFEMVPDRLPEELRTVISKFPPGSLQFEVGVQTFNPDVAERISRRQNYERLEENLRFLRQQTGVHIHADLIAGLPGEVLASFAAGFDRLIALLPHEIQVGILKRLRGTPIIRHDAEWQMVYSPHPPYEMLQNRLLDFPTMQRLRRFARYWDLVGNSGNFIATTPLIWQGETSPFHAFMRWCDWLFAQTGRTDAIALARLMELLFGYLIIEKQLAPPTVAKALWQDYQRGGRSDKPSFLVAHLPAAPVRSARPRARSLKRQSRHATPD
jgi:radical SAM superfamily enzyme YgiQ (UPF0313 family)